MFENGPNHESALLAAVVRLEREDLAEASDPQLEQSFADVHRAMERLELERLRRLAALHERRVHARDGYLSEASWVADTFRVAPREAARDAQTGVALSAMAGAKDAVKAGDLSLSAARVLAGAQRWDPVAYARSEESLLGEAIGRRVSDVHRAVSSWRVRIAADHRGETDSSFATRALDIGPTASGMVRIEGCLDPENGETVLTAIRTCVDGQVRCAADDDRRTAVQRRADALGEICRHWLDSCDRPAVGGERPHVSLTVDVRSLAGTGSGVPGQLDHVGPVGWHVTQLLACDASVSRVLMGGRSEPLNVGRRTPVVPAGLRRAVAVRDRGCRFPGCDRPPPWCDAHHVVHWAKGGPTSMQNLVLMCRRHHRMIHHGRFSVDMTEGRPVFLRRDGTRVEDRGPP